MNDTPKMVWSRDDMLEVELVKEDSFLIAVETLQRIGMVSDNVLTQTCHILHKRGKYYLMHFKELFALDGKKNIIELEDIHRRNAIASMLENWNIIRVKNKDQIAEKTFKGVKSIPHKDKKDWILKPVYVMGKK